MDLVEKISDAWWAEHRRWTLRFNKMRGGIWEAVRTLDMDGPISEDNMRVIDLPSKASDDAEAEFEVMRDDASARSVLSCLEENGMVVVPREPTEEQGQAMYAAWDRFPAEHGVMGPIEAVAIYRAAVAAAPKHG